MHGSLAHSFNNILALEYAHRYDPSSLLVFISHVRCALLFLSTQFLHLNPSSETPQTNDGPCGA